MVFDKRGGVLVGTRVSWLGLGNNTDFPNTVDLQRHNEINTTLAALQLDPAYFRSETKKGEPFGHFG